MGTTKMVIRWPLCILLLFIFPLPSCRRHYKRTEEDIRESRRKMKSKWDPRKEIQITQQKSEEIVEGLDLLSSIDIDQIENKKLLKEDDPYGEFPKTFKWRHRTQDIEETIDK